MHGSPYTSITIKAALLSLLSILTCTTSSSFAEGTDDPEGRASLTPQVTSQTTSSETVIDAVVASVDDKPITLSELNSRLRPVRSLSLIEARTDKEALQRLEAFIQERVLEEEASLKKVGVTDADIDEYISEVAKRNGITTAEMPKALASEGKDYEGYKSQVKLDILKTRLASTVARNTISISDREIEDYLKKHPEISSKERSLKLKQILISSEKRTSDEYEARIKLVVTTLESGADFSDVARQFSDSPDAADGGSLGIIAEKDLSSEIKDALLESKVGTYSAPLRSSLGAQIFFLEQRLGSSESDEEDRDEDEVMEELKVEAKKTLQQQKAQEKIVTYFQSDLAKSHSVEKKL